MKRKDLEKRLSENGWTLKRHGANHDIWEKDGKQEAVPRHNEISERLAQAIIRRQGLK
ncbi:MAG: type II toxin-antitoxin system HicA family toxin [Christensenellales bacterium]|jgi:mRNA interferase HicA